MCDEVCRYACIMQVLRHPIQSLTTLKRVIEEAPFSFSTSQATLEGAVPTRFQVGRSHLLLGNIHAAAFVHQNTTSPSIVSLRRPKSSMEASLDSTHLMGFGLIRGVDSITYKEGTVGEAQEMPFPLPPLAPEKGLGL